MNPRTPLAAATALAFVLTIAACSSAPAPADEQAPASPPPASTPAPINTQEPVDVEEPAVDPTCETIIAPSTIEPMTEVGWTFQEKEFRLGAEALEGGFQCIWGDYTVGSDHVAIYGWAPLDSADAVEAQQKLLTEGWQRADADGHTYITEDPSVAIAPDSDGFGMTYEFGEGWVTLADTRESLLLIVRP